MEQHDCPFIDTTVEHDVSFSAVQWEFNESSRELGTRMVVEGADRDALDNGLDALQAHDNLERFRLQTRWGDTAQIRTRIQETDAMARIRANDGFITGPFYIDGGSELWHVGFDRPAVADETLSALERNNEFVVMSRESFDGSLVSESVETVQAGLDLVRDCQQLTRVERETLESAVHHGYFESPRDTSLSGLADELDVSPSAVSKNLRRGQEKLVSSVLDTLGHVED